MSELPTNSKDLEFINKVPNPIKETPIDQYEPFKKIGLSVNEIPEEIIIKAEELGIEKVLRIAGEIIAQLEKVIPIIEWILGWLKITPKKELTSKQRVNAVSEAINILTRLNN